MLKHLMSGTSWIALRAPENEEGTPEFVPPQGDPHGDEVLEGGPPDPAEVPPVEAGETPPELETPPAPPVAEEPPAHKPDWRDKELGRRKRRLDEEVAARQTVEAENKRLRDLAESLARQAPAEPADGQQPPPAPRQPQERVYTQAELEAEADRRANAKFQETSFKNDFDGAYRAGSSQFGKAKMDEAIGRISELGGLDYDHLQMVLGTDDPSKVLYELGSKPEEFQRIMDLPFNKRVVEFAKMGLKTEPARRPSNTPPPVEPIGGGGGNVDNRYRDDVEDAAWFAAEEKRSAAAWKKKQEGWRG
jgi:hypothetical protein